MDFIQCIDFQILDFIQTHIKNPVLDAFMPFITSLGNAGALWIIFAVLCLILKKYRKDGIALSVALILGFFLCNLILKNIFSRPRPFIINTFTELLISPPIGYSFPSGHSCASFAAATVLLKTTIKKIGIPAVIIAILIAFSRMYLYVHFTTDVIAGAVLGVFCGIVAIKIVEKIKLLNKLQYSKTYYLMK